MLARLMVPVGPPDECLTTLAPAAVGEPSGLTGGPAVPATDPEPGSPDPTARGEGRAGESPEDAPPAVAGAGTVGRDGVGGGVFTIGVRTDGVVTTGDGTDGVVTAGVVIDGIVAGGVDTEGAVTGGVDTGGIAPTGVETAGVVTDGTEPVGVVTAGVVTAGTRIDGVVTVGSGPDPRATDTGASIVARASISSAAMIDRCRPTHAVGGRPTRSLPRARAPSPPLRSRPPSDPVRTRVTPAVGPAVRAESAPPARPRHD